ncbi:hypothetical protein YC2023_051439 [Brassica napus]
MDLRCSSISEPFDYQGHKHPLYEGISMIITFSQSYTRKNYVRTIVSYFSEIFVHIFCLTSSSVSIWSGFYVEESHAELLRTLD